MLFNQVVEIRDKQDGLTERERRVLNFIEEHPDEVFCYDSSDICNAVKFKKFNKTKYVGWVLESLVKKGRIQCYTVRSIPRGWGIRRTFFGTPQAIQKLKEEDERRW